MIKIKNYQVYDENNQKAVNDLMSKDLKGASALKVVKIARKLQDLLVDIEKSVKIVREKYTEKDENGNPLHPVDEDGTILADRIKIKDPKAFTDEIDEIMKVENEIVDIEPLSEKEIENTDISPKTIILLEWLIK